jgi:hypothetical protein
METTRTAIPCCSSSTAALTASSISNRLRSAQLWHRLRRAVHNHRGQCQRSALQYVPDTADSDARKSVLGPSLRVTCTPCHSGFHCVARTPVVQIRDQTQAGNVFYGLMRRTIFTETDRIMGTNRLRTFISAAMRSVAAVVREGQESCAEWR